ncbi:MAG: hypothetical protein IJ007_10095 [Oscillospiraceae bacterium]|nr:hypothetical protein [Oscillospiraceae bacterium]
MTDKFRQLMHCGHGRCFNMIKGNEEKLKETVLYGCLNDLSFDIQCEGSRGCYMYNLALQFADSGYFLKAAAEKFLADEVNTDWNSIHHLADFISCFASDGSAYAEDVLEQKYAELFKLIMSTRAGSVRHSRLLESYEYVSIIVMQLNERPRMIEILNDMGAYFIRRRRAEDDDLKWQLAWFYTNVKTEYGVDILNELKDDTLQIRRFKRVMEVDRKLSEVNRESLRTADEIIEKIQDGRLKGGERFRFGVKAPEDEKIKLARNVINESDPEKKADLLFMFDSNRNLFPLEHTYLTEYAQSGNEHLREAALDAMTHLKSDIVHDFAMELFEREKSVSSVMMLIVNYRPDDKKILLDFLESLEIDREDKIGWHGIVQTIIDEAGNDIPDEMLMFVYEKSMCSCCREYVLEPMKKRGLITDMIISECLWDCNEYIREFSEKQG